jgi:hypothetical protein
MTIEPVPNTKVAKKLNIPEIPIFLEFLWCVVSPLVGPYESGCVGVRGEDKRQGHIRHIACLSIKIQYNNEFGVL